MKNNNELLIISFFTSLIMLNILNIKIMFLSFFNHLKKLIILLHLFSPCLIIFRPLID
jgi:hypothetical protein